MLDGIKNNLCDELKKIVAEVTEMDEGKITPTAKFVEDLGMDSMMALEILAAVEKKYKLKIPESYLGKILTLSQLLEITEKLLVEKA